MSKSEQFKAVWLFGDVIVFILTVIVILSSVVGLYSYKMTDFSIAVWCGVLLIPLFILNILLVVYHLIRKHYYLSIGNIIVVIMCVPTIFSLSFFNSKTENNNAKAITLASYNVKNFNLFSSNGNTIQHITYLIKKEGIEIAAFQEFSFKGNDHEFTSRLPKGYSIKSAVIESKREIFTGLANISKYPIVDTFLKVDSDSIPYMLCSDIAVNGDTVRLFNIRLHSTSVTQTAKGVISNHQNTNKKIVNLLNLYGINATKRRIQADTVTKYIAKSPYKVIVCGDFNDTPTSYAYKTISQNLDDSFYEAGNGYSYTYNGFYRTLRIDYILCGDGVVAADYNSPRLDFSDHKPIIAKVAIH